MLKSSTTEAILKSKIDADVGFRMLKNAKDIVAHVINHLQPTWVEPMVGESGKGRDGKVKNRAIHVQGSTMLLLLLKLSDVFVLQSRYPAQ